jgi:PAS domain S-box-containing protein
MRRNRAGSLREHHQKDTVDRRGTEVSVLEFQEGFRDAGATTGDWIWEVDAQGRYVYSSPVVERILGYTVDEVLGKRFYDLLCSDERKRLERAFSKVLNGKQQFVSLVSRHVHKNGRIVIVETSGVAVLDRKGRLVGYRGSNRDITERRRLEEGLSALNFYGSKLNAACTLQQIYDLTLDTMEKTLGFEYAAFMILEKDSLRVACHRGYLDPLYVELPLNGAKKGITVKTAKERRPVSVSDVRKDQDYFEGVKGILSELAVPVETEERLIGILDVESRETAAFSEQDITLLQILASHAATAISNLRKREEIERQGNQLASLMKSSEEMIRTTDLPERLNRIAKAIAELGWRRVVITVVGRDMEPHSEQDVVTAGLSAQEREYIWANRLPGQVWRERLGPEYERFRIGEFYHLPWSDPWVRKRFSEDALPSKLLRKDMIDWDPQDLLYAPLRLSDGRVVGLVSIDDPLDGRRPTKQSLASLELFLRHAAVAIENGRLIRQLDDAKNEIQEYAQHLEEKVEERTKQVKEAQTKLLKAERLAAIGQVSAMVGHDLRNPLTGISGATYYLKTKLRPSADKRAKDMLELIEKSVQYSNKIISDLLEYSAEVRLELKENSPKSVVHEALSLVEIPRNVEIRDLTRDTPKAIFDLEKMKRVFVNIVKNAVESMPEGGRLTISSRASNRNLEIFFADTGMGMSKEVIERIWTPFVTTKARGMGLGLAVCKRIVEAHRGRITVESRAGKGTVFTVSVPIKPVRKTDHGLSLGVPECLLVKTGKG